MRERRVTRTIPAPVIRGTQRRLVPAEELDEDILYSPVGTVFISGLGGSWWVCQRYHEDGSMYCWDGITERDYESIYSLGCRERSIWFADWHPLIIVKVPSHDLNDTHGDPYDDFNQFRYEAMREWKQQYTSTDGNIIIE